MNDIEIIDNYMDEREFRNYIIPFLESKGYTLENIDDTRIIDDNHYNNNNLIVIKDDFRYAVKALANYKITLKEINDVIKDIENKHVGFGIILTNTEVDLDIQEHAQNNGITIYDRTYFKK